LSTRPAPLYIGCGDAARVLGVGPRTVRKWAARGELRAVVHHHRHYTDERPRKGKPRWRIEVASILELLERLYAGEPVPPAIRKRLNAIGNPLPAQSPKGP
jgi:excisionase family DNA binding protein